MDYEHLREEYPAVISMEQLYRICHISKRHARWLLEQGMIPCQDSGKHTRRFQIKLDDVIVYLQQRETGELPAPPRGLFNSVKLQLGGRRKYLDGDDLAAYILAAWLDAPDALTAAQAAALSCYWVTTICAWHQKGAVRGVSYYGKLMLAKTSLALHLASIAGQRIQPKSPQHQALLDEYRQRMGRGEVEMKPEDMTSQENSDMVFGSLSL